MWDRPGSGLEPVSPALAGGFLTTEPPGKSSEGYYEDKMECDTFQIPGTEVIRVLVVVVVLMVVIIITIIIFKEINKIWKKGLPRWHSG